MYLLLVELFCILSLLQVDWFLLHLNLSGKFIFYLHCTWIYLIHLFNILYKELIFFFYQVVWSFFVFFSLTNFIVIYLFRIFLPIFNLSENQKLSHVLFTDIKYADGRRLKKLWHFEFRFQCFKIPLSSTQRIKCTSVMG